MAATLQYGRERAHLGRSLLNFMRIARDAHAPDLTLASDIPRQRLTGGTIVSVTS